MKSFKKSKNDKKLVPKLFILSYAVIGVGLIIYLYILFCEKVPSGKILFYPEWEILKGGSCSCDLDHFTLSDKELSQLYIIGPFFVAMGSLLKLLGLKRQ